MEGVVSDVRCGAAQMFSQFYNAYVNAVSNPFYTFGTVRLGQSGSFECSLVNGAQPLKSPIFEAKMEALSKGVA